MTTEDLYHLHEKGMLSLLDIHFAAFLGRLAGKNAPEVSFSAALVSSHRRQGHICLDLSAIAGKPLPGEEEEDSPVVICPKLDVWCGRLRESDVVGKPGENKPLILDDGFRLYLFRYWDYQQNLAGSINNRVNKAGGISDINILGEGLARLFPGEPTAEGVDMQMVAAFAALRRRFCVISGGPGTGKTTTVARILALLIEQSHSSNPRIVLTTPTGKGATRLQEAIREVRADLDCQENVRSAIPSEASTIHRLLGSIKGSPYFRHDAQNLLNVDVVVVDEASMVDLALMSKLVQAIPMDARLIMLGDKDQIASVEAGAVLGDICDTGSHHAFSGPFCRDFQRATGREIAPNSGREGRGGISDCIIQLEKSYRFERDSGIALIGDQVNRGDGEAAIELLLSGRHRDVAWRPLPEADALSHAARRLILKGYGLFSRASDPEACWDLFDQFRILCVFRDGPFGVVALNALVEKVLMEEKLITPHGDYYAGQPLMIRVNDYNLQLFNGDVGIVLRDPEVNNELRVFFPADEGAFRKFHPIRLPEHETVYAMTVHKSQGSEFDRVLLILPDMDSPLLTRELLYTAITRAKKTVEIWGPERFFPMAVTRRTDRMSGLRDALWGKE